MAEKEKKTGGLELTRRGFLKAGAAATAVAAGGMEWAATVGPASASIGDVASETFNSTCPYCSAQCAQKVAVATEADAEKGIAIGDVIDVYGDVASPTNRGGLCAKGAGSYQLVTNARRLGVGSTHPVNDVFANTDDDVTYPTGVAYKRLGNNDWERMDLEDALEEIAEGSADASGLHDYRGPVNPAVDAEMNSRGVVFFGSSHMNNEPNYMYRRLIAQFGTSHCEHQARI